MTFPERIRLHRSFWILDSVKNDLRFQIRGEINTWLIKEKPLFMKVLKFFRRMVNHYHWLLAKDEISAFPPESNDTDHGTAVRAVETTDGVRALGRFFFFGNWKVNNQELPRFQVHGEGRILEQFIAGMIADIARRKPTARVGWSWDADTQEGTSKTLRVTDRISPGHLVASDLAVYQRDGDLFIGMSGKAWSKTRFWVRAVGSVVLIALFFVALSWAVNQPGFRQAWVRDYARKHANTSTATISNGSGGASQGQSFTNVEPLENLILRGSSPSGEQVLGNLMNLMQGHSELIGDYEAVLSKYLNAYQEACVKVDPEKLKQSVDEWIARGFEIDQLSDLGVFSLSGSGVASISGCSFGISQYQLLSAIANSGADTRSFNPVNSRFVSKYNTLDEAVGSLRTWEDKVGAEKAAQLQYRLAPRVGGFDLPPPVNYIEGGMDDLNLERGGGNEIERRKNSKGEIYFAWKADQTPGLTKKENEDYYDARVSLGKFAKISPNSEQQIAYAKDSSIRQALVTWITLGHKSRIQPLKEFVGDLQSKKDAGQGYATQVVANIVLFGLLTGDFDTMIRRLPPSVRNEFSKEMKSTVTPPWSTFKLFNADWLLFLTGPAKVPVLLFGVLWAGAMFLPRSGVRYLCSVFRWPAPETFDTAIASQNTTIQGMISTLLRGQFRITQDRIIEIRNRT